MIFTKKRIRQIATASIVVLVVSLIPIIVTSFFSHPIRDDFGYAVYVHNVVENGGNIFQMISAGIQKTINTYQVWQGTYSAVFLFAMQPGVISENAYFISTFLILGILIYSTFFLIRTIFKTLKLDEEYATIISSVILILSIQFVYDKSQAFFWWNGAVYYTVFYSFALILFACLIRFYTTLKKKSRIKYFTLSIVLAFIIGGGNYSTALCTLVILALAIVLLIKKAKKEAVHFWAVFAVILTGLVISAIAPGNSVRADLYEGLSPVQAVAQSLVRAAKFFCQWTGLPQIAAFALIAMVVFRLTKRVGFDFKYPLAVCIVTFLVFATQLTPPLYAMGSVGGGRQVNIYYYSYYLVSVINLFYVCGWLNKQEIFTSNEKNIKPKLFRCVVIAVLVIFGFGCWEYGFNKMTSVDTSIALIDGTTRQYQREYFRAIKQIKNGNREIQDIKTVPDFFLEFGLGSSTSYWVNKQLSNYYHVDSIVKKEDAIL